MLGALESLIPSAECLCNACRASGTRHDSIYKELENARESRFLSLFSRKLFKRKSATASKLYTHAGKIEAGTEWITVRRAQGYPISMRILRGKISSSCVRVERTRSIRWKPSRVETGFRVTRTDRRKRWKLFPVFLEIAKVLPKVRVDPFAFSSIPPCLFFHESWPPGFSTIDHHLIDVYTNGLMVIYSSLIILRRG